MHAVVSELVKSIISMSAPSPGAGITDGLQNGPASNLFARHLAKRENIERLVGFMLDDFTFEMQLLEAQKGMNSGPTHKSTETTSTPPPPASPQIPNLETATSSGTHAISIIIELIRKNNSDYFEPYLFHTIRNRLIHIQQHMHMQSDEGRESLEQAFNEMVHRMGVVHFGPLLEIMCDRLERFQQLLHKPRSTVRFFTRIFNRDADVTELTERATAYDSRFLNSVNFREVQNMRALCGITALLKYVPTQPSAGV